MRRRAAVAAWHALSMRGAAIVRLRATPLANLRSGYNHYVGNLLNSMRPAP